MPASAARARKLLAALLLTLPTPAATTAGAAVSPAQASPEASRAPSPGDWIATGPLDAGPALDLVADPKGDDTLYLAAGQGLFVSRDGGATWEPPALPGLRALAVSPRPPWRLYAVTQGGVSGGAGLLGLWRSDDQGRHWRAMAMVGGENAAAEPTGPAAPPPPAAETAPPVRYEARYEVRSLAVHPDEPDVVVVAARSWETEAATPGSPGRGRLWRSRDGGATLEAQPVPEGFDAADLLFTRDGTLFAATAAGVFRSSNRGRTWQPARDGLEAPTPGDYLAVRRLAASAETPLVLYAGTAATAPAGPALYRGSDEGEHWEAVAGSLPAGGVADLLLDRRDRRSLFAAVEGFGVWGTRGGDWSALPSLPDGAEPVALALVGDAPGSLLVATAAGELLRQAPPPPPCVEDATTLCLAGRFRVDLEWWSEDGLHDAGRAVPLTPTSGWFWSTTPDSPGAAVRVVDARAVDGHWWIYWSALADDGLSLRVFDTAGGDFRVYSQPPGIYTAGADATSFPAGADDHDATTGGLWLSSLPEGGCGDDSPDLCLWGGRFRVAIDWEDGDQAAVAVADRLSPQAGWFRFSTTGDPELFVQVLDGRPVNGHWWVVFGGLTGAAYEVRVSDGESGQTVTYAVAAGEATSHADRRAFYDASGGR